MKKTLIALLALGSMAMGEEVSLFTIEPTTTTAATAAEGGEYMSSVLSKNDSINITTSAPSVETFSGSGTLSPSNFTRSIFSVQTNIGNGGSYTFEQNFEVEALNGATITLTSLDVDFFAHGGSGQQQTQSRGLKATLTLTKVGEEVPLPSPEGREITIPASSGIYSSAYNASGDRQGGTTQTFTLPSNVDLSAGNYTLSIKVENLTAGQQGTFIGIGHVGAKGTVSQVPEPATGTLSLLALAGLCARRRKK